MADAVRRTLLALPPNLAADALAQLAEHSHDGLLILDTEERFRLWNPFMERLTGIRADAALGRPMQELFPQLAGMPVVVAIRNALAGETVHMRDSPEPGQSLETARWFSAVFAPLRSSDGTIQGVVVTLADVTTRKRAERNLLDRENRLKAILLSQPECVKLVARDCTLIEMNPAGLAMLEVDSLSTLVGRDITEVVAEPYRDGFRELQGHVFTGRSGTLQFEIIGLNGTRRWVESHATPLIDAEGHIAAALYVTRDITERRRSEQALREARERTSRALAAAAMAFWEIELAPDGVIWAENLEAVLGRPVQEYRGLIDGLERVHIDDREQVARAMRQAVETGPGFKMEYRVNWPDGTLHWVNTVGWVSPPADGRPSRLLGITTDITERRSLEAQLRQSQKMEAIGLLAGGVAHDFNNLLTVINGYSRLLAEKCAEAQKTDLQEIIKAAERAAALTRQLLAFSRRQLLQAEVVDLNVLVPELTNMLQRLVGEQLELVLDLGAELGTVRADRVQLEQVVMNLVVNARDAMPEGGRILISTSNAALEIRSEQNSVTVFPGRYVRLAVRDTGHGMNEEVKARIFEPFFTTKKRKDAAGLGLSTVYGIVVQSGGHLRVDSTPGQGTTFEVWLPRIDEAVRPQPEPVAPEAVVAVGGGVLILVAEDEPAVRRLARRVLESAGYRVVDAADPAEAEIVFEQNADQISLLLTDIVMPGGTGPELYARLKAKKPQLRAVCMSAYAEASVLSEGHNLGGAAFLQKPFSVPALVRAVQRVLET